MRPSTPPAPPTAEEPNPFRFGWRFVKKTLPDGSTDLEQVPLTLEDLLHPQEGDVRPVRPLHEADCTYLADVFRSRPLGPTEVHIPRDQLIDWGVEGLRDHSPDIAVFVGLREKANPHDGTFHLADSGGRCLLAVEVASPDSRDNDVVHKLREYHQARVPLYVIIDQEDYGGPRQLLAYRWEESGYANIALDAQGRLLLDFLGVYLSVTDDRVVCHDAATGRELGNYSRICQELEEADRRIQEQEQALTESVEAARLARRQAELAERAREDTERRAQDRIRELEALVRQLQGGPTPPAA